MDPLLAALVGMNNNNDASILHTDNNNNIDTPTSAITTIITTTTSTPTRSEDDMTKLRDKYELKVELAWDVVEKDGTQIIVNANVIVM